MGLCSLLLAPTLPTHWLRSIARSSSNFVGLLPQEEDWDWTMVPSSTLTVSQILEEKEPLPLVGLAPLFAPLPRWKEPLVGLEL